VRTFASRIKDKEMQKVFVPAYFLKLIGGLAYGLIYQYYYGGGFDTTYFFLDARLLNEAFWEDYGVGLRLIFGEANVFEPYYNDYARRLSYFKDPASYMVSRIAGIFGLFCYAKYLPLSIFFATYSFWGSWQFYRVLCSIYPDMKKQMATAVFFFPSVFFWGSGVLKDSVTFGALGLCVYGFYYGILTKSNERVKAILLLMLGIFLLKSIKIYILMCLLPSFAYWAFTRYAKTVDNAIIRMMTGPLFMGVFGVVGYYLLQSVAAGTEYDLNNIAHEIKITSDWLRSISKDGSYYTFGELDGTFENALQYFVPAVLTTLYRPAIWEVSNPMMLLSAIENTYLMVLTLSIFVRTPPLRALKSIFKEEIVAVALIFTLGFSFFVGLASANFGTLVRYKIPMMPFYIAMVLVIYEQNFVRAKKKQKFKISVEEEELTSEEKSDADKNEIDNFRKNVIT
jgi:hypothetical protein